MADPEEILPPDDDRRHAILALALAHFTEDADHLNYDWVYEQLGMERGKKTNKLARAYYNWLYQELCKTRPPPPREGPKRQRVAPSSAAEGSSSSSSRAHLGGGVYGFLEMVGDRSMITGSEVQHNQEVFGSVTDQVTPFVGKGGAGPDSGANASFRRCLVEK